MKDRKNIPKWYDIQLKNGEVHEVDEEKFKKIREILAENRATRADFINLDENTTIRIDSIVSIKLEKDEF